VWQLGVGALAPTNSAKKNRASAPEELLSTRPNAIGETASSVFLGHSAPRARFRFFFAALFLLSLFVASASRAQERCPWLNAATAAGALDAGVTMTVTHPTGKPTDAVCEFTHKQGSDSRQVRVQVEVMADPAAGFSSYLTRCGADATPLKAIGNEAVVCSVPVKNAQAEQVVGRVRDQAFIVLLRSNDKSVAISTLRDRVGRIAEIVAGNLF
jgi:hypothetical protein